MCDLWGRLALMWSTCAGEWGMTHTSLHRPYGPCVCVCAQVSAPASLCIGNGCRSGSESDTNAATFFLRRWRRSWKIIRNWLKSARAHKRGSGPSLRHGWGRLFPERLLWGSAELRSGSLADTSWFLESTGVSSLSCRMQRQRCPGRYHVSDLGFFMFNFFKGSDRLAQQRRRYKSPLWQKKGEKKKKKSPLWHHKWLLFRNFVL